MVDRVMLFIDYQNTYHIARTLYHDLTAPARYGQVDPGALGRLLVDQSPYDRELAGVRVYRWLPSATKDSKGYGASRAQIFTWDEDPAVTRPLWYPRDYPSSRPKEKGIDVALAVDFVMGAVKGWYNVGIMMSLDTDLKPALECVVDELQGIRVEVAAWNQVGERASWLSIKGSNLWCHWLNEPEYEAVRDDHDYNRGSRWRTRRN